MNKVLSCFAIGLVLIFVIQVLYYLAQLVGITFMNEGEIVSGPPIGFTMYIVPLIFFVTGFYFLYLEKRRNN